MMDEEIRLDNAQEDNLDAAMGDEGVTPVEAHQSAVEGDAAAVDRSAVEELTDDMAEEAAPADSEGTATQDAESMAAIAGLSQEIESLKAQLEDRTQQYMRIAADFENFRRRTQGERQSLETQAKCSTIKELLPVVDNFERARSQIKPETEGEMTIHKSYQSVYKQLVDCLKRIGVAPMRAEGQEFDPNLHEAVMRQPTSEYEEGVVMEELMRGYLLGDRVLRHAMVKVAAAPDPDMEPNSAEAGTETEPAAE
ncbi:MAG: nucleotide exchange factor GrpE [Thainema sp.]